MCIITDTFGSQLKIRIIISWDGPLSKNIIAVLNNIVCDCKFLLQYHNGCDMITANKLLRLINVMFCRSLFLIKETLKWKLVIKNFGNC